MRDEGDIERVLNVKRVKRVFISPIPYHKTSVFCLLSFFFFFFFLKKKKKKKKKLTESVLFQFQSVIYIYLHTQILVRYGRGSVLGFQSDGLTAPVLEGPSYSAHWCQLCRSAQTMVR